MITIHDVCMWYGIAGMAYGLHIVSNKELMQLCEEKMRKRTDRTWYAPWIGIGLVVLFWPLFALARMGHDR